ncbi:transcriptional regulator [Pedobacter agri]|uniref:Transcriptional regulator n=1 Tax=Pedobacter agri TaxID=454586 RepID=A0A9X3DE48_9SPHI|nr:transcriptional regulator [Pedobacter agri]MCX3265627.1 transcriptional regulator [Pedobacter agri]
MKKLNNIKGQLKTTKLRVATLALVLDIDDTTLSKWNSNIVQPSLNRIDEIGQILEVDNKDLLTSQNRDIKGIADALQFEYNRLIDVGLTKKITITDNEGNNKQVNNPIMVKALKEFVEKFGK